MDPCTEDKLHRGNLPLGGLRHGSDETSNGFLDSSMTLEAIRGILIKDVRIHVMKLFLCRVGSQWRMESPSVQSNHLNHPEVSHSFYITREAFVTGGQEDCAEGTGLKLYESKLISLCNWTRHPVSIGDQAGWRNP